MDLALNNLQRLINKPNQTRVPFIIMAKLIVGFEYAIISNPQKKITYQSLLVSVFI